MQIQLSTHVFVEAIQRVQVAISTRSTLPILAHINFVYAHGMCSLSATNLEIGIRTYLPKDQVEVQLFPEECVEVDKNGEEKEVLLHGFTFDPLAILPQLKKTIKTTKGVKSSPMLVLVYANSTLSYIYNNQRGTLETMDTIDFPTIPIPTDYQHMQSDDTFSFDLEELRRICTHTLFAAADDDSRPVMTGICIRRIVQEIPDGKKRKKGEKPQTRSRMTFEGADAFRLGRVTYDLEGYTFEQGMHPDILIPARTLENLFMKSEKAVFPKKGRVTCIVMEHRSQILFYEETTRTIAVSRLIEGTFPKTESVIAMATRDTNLFITLTVENLIQGMEAVEKAAKDSTWITHIALRKRPSGITSVILFAQSETTKRYSNITEGTTITGKETYNGSFIVNWVYLMDVLKSYKQQGIKTITFHSTNTHKPLVFTPGEQNCALTPLLCIIMPMSTNNSETGFSEEELLLYIGSIPIISQAEEKPLTFYQKHGYFPGSMVDVSLFSDLDEKAPIVVG